MKEIPLTQGKVAIVDDEDYSQLMKYKWCLHGAGYAHTSTGTAYVLMHRMVLSAAKNQRVDHINQNKLDNRKSNLRFCTHQNNIRNSKLNKHNTTGYRGVHFYKPRGNFVAGIGLDYKRKFLGYFLTAEEAARAYDRAASQHFGEFAVLNFPVEAR